MKRVGLRPYFLFSFFLSVIVVGLISAELWVASDQWEHTAVLLNQTVESIGTAQMVSDSLDNHRRQALLGDLRDQQSRDAARVTTERDLIRELNKIEALQRDDPEVIHRARTAVDRYLYESNTFELKNVRGDDLYIRTAQTFEAAKGALSQLIAVEEIRAVALEKEAVRQGANYKSWSIGLFVFVMSAILFALWLFQHFVFTPIMELRDSIENFSLLRSIPPVPSGGLSEIHDISSAFHAMVTTLQRQNEQRLIFLSAVAHDLKNPLSAIQMSLDLMLSPRALPETTPPLTAIVKRQVTQLRRLVDDLLDATRIESGNLQLKLSRQDLGSVLSDSAQLFQSLSEIHHLHISLPEEAIQLECDPQRLTQVFNNLLSNAIKYSPKGGDVRVNLQKAGDFAVISVADQGIGIDNADFEAIFEPFRRPSAGVHQIPGVGLGLSTSRKIIEAHQGWIRVQSRPAHGTVFLISLPLITGENEEVSPSQNPTAEPPSSLNL